MSKTTLLVLAAGMGSRYGGLKQLDAVGPSGETIIDYSIYDAVRAGFEKVVFVIRRDIEDAFKSTIGDRYASRIEVAYAFQELDELPEGFAVPEGREKPWGTGHAIWMARNDIDGPFAVINGDDFYGADAFGVMADYLKTAKDGDKADYSMVGYTVKNTLSEHGGVSRGLCRCSDEGYLQEAVETHGIVADGDAAKYPSEDKPDQFVFLTGDELVSMNLWGFTTSLFANLEAQFVDFLKERGTEMKSEFYIPAVVNRMIQEGKATAMVLKSDAKWFGVTYREDKERAQASICSLVDQGVYPQTLWP